MLEPSEPWVRMAGSNQRRGQMDIPVTMIGAPVSQIQGPDKVAGRARFAADVDVPGMLWGKILRSPHPHARIRRIDAAAAWSVPGVKAVVTGQDAPGRFMGKVLRDMPVLCWDRVRYIGDRVAAVAAETPEAAAEALLRIDVDGRIQAWCSSKAPFRARMQLAQALGLRDEQIRVNVVAVGGDFGGKGDARDLPVAYLLAQMAQRPVKIVMSYGEELTASNPTHPTVVTMRSGVTRDGRLTARAVRTVHASGAYGAMKPRSFLSTSHYVGGGYRVPHTSFEFLHVYTNTTPGGYFRAPGAHQYTFALECHTDLLARALGLDPAAFRRRNLVGPGEEDAVGRPLRVADVRQVLEAALEAGRWGEPKAGPGRGKGVAIFGRQIGGGAAGAVLTAEADGAFTVISPTVDVGTGTHTIEQQIVATEMDVPLSWVRGRQGDADSTPFDEGPRASRVTYTEGQAVMKACAQMRQAMHDGATLPLTITVEHDAPQPEDVMYFCAQVAEVDVDRETGQVKVLKVVTAHDVGTIINSLAHQGQIDGGFVTGLGLAVTEELVSEDGQILNGHLGEYKLPTIADIPPLETVLVHTSGGAGPYQAKAIGELANNATAAAIANAVADAVGCQLFELPITAERVYAALHQVEKPEPA